MLVSQAAGLAALIVFAAARGSGPPDLTRLLPAAAGGVAGLIALSAFYRALAIGTMSIVAPISATGVAVPVVVGIATGDRPSAPQLAGIIAGAVGIVLASRERVSAEARHVSRASIALALVAALGFGSFFVGLRAGARADVLWALIAGRTASVLVLLCAVGVMGAPGRGPVWKLTIIGLLDVGANGLFALATRHGLLSLVAVASSLYPLMTVALARGILKERVRRVQEVGIAIALAGVILMSL